MAGRENTILKTRITPPRSLHGAHTTAFFASALFLLAIITNLFSPLAPAADIGPHDLSADQIFLVLEKDGSLSLNGILVEPDALISALSWLPKSAPKPSILIEITENDSTERLAEIRELISSTGDFEVGTLNKTTR